MPKYLLCNGDRNELDLIYSENSIKSNNNMNSKFYINPIGRPNNKERQQKMGEKNDVRALLLKNGYIKTFQDVKSPVKEYKNYHKNIFNRILGKIE